MFGDRSVEMAYVGFRVYREKKGTQYMQSDQKGTFKGWTHKFDEWLPIYSPRI